MSSELHQPVIRIRIHHLPRKWNDSVSYSDSLKEVNVKEPITYISTELKMDVVGQHTQLITDKKVRPTPFKNICVSSLPYPVKEN